jgi:2-keto-4-pentenoate hydratase/2-oxohepta-3-ene-1,7-dioic acid hydratase in catechol pathway
MKLIRFTAGGRTSIGVVENNQAIRLEDLLPGAPTSLKDVLAGGADYRRRIAAALTGKHSGLPLAQVRLEAPIPDPQKYLAIGMNYHDHAEETRRAGLPVPTIQLWFNKQVTCIVGPYDDVHKPRASDKVDYEAELGVVIGQQCRHVTEADAPSVVGGYFVANDVTTRDWQLASPTFTLGKSFDTHGPIGPWIVTPDEIPDPHNLEMRLYVNGELRQKQSTGQMIHNIWKQIAHLSTVMTLMPGDLIATGTCAGVGIALNKYLQPGDVVRVEIDGVGEIENRIVAEP